jgi:hypothetical protein
MKSIKTWVQFFEAKNYTESDRKKDNMRISDMVEKAKDMDHLLRLATTMANSITNYDKAYNRGIAAENAGYYEVAKIFWKRANKIKRGDI